MMNRVILSIILFCVVTVETDAQSRYQQKKAKLDSALTARYYRTPYDTNYVIRPEGRWTLKVRLNQTGNTIHAKAEENGIHSKADLSTSHKTTVSVAATYRGLSASLALNPAKFSGAYKDYEFMSTKFRLNVAFGQRITLKIAENKRKRHNRITLFYEIGACDLYIRSLFQGQDVSVGDIIGLSIGAKFFTL